MHPQAPRPGGSREPVARSVLFRTPLLEIRDNRCSRDDPALSPEIPPLGWHEVALPRQGLWFRHLGRRALPVDSHHVHFLNRGESHRVSHPAGCGDANTGIVVEPVSLQAIVAEVDPAATPESPFTRTYAIAGDRLHAAHRVLLAAVRDTEPDRVVETLAVEELALLLVAATVRCSGQEPERREGSVPRSQRDLAEAARALLHRHLSEPLSLGDVAEALAASPFHLCRAFSAHAGMPLHRYRLLLRLRMAVGLMLEGGAPLADIAAATGFHDRSHLSRLSRRHLGLAPAELRRRARAGRIEELMNAMLCPE